ncbi:MAG TPA: hypothetical protein VGJ04_01035 [Pirellulales bacterium]
MEITLEEGKGGVASLPLYCPAIGPALEPSDEQLPSLDENLPMNHHIRPWIKASSVTITWVACMVACSWAVAQDYEELPLFQDNAKPIEAWSKLGGPLRDKTDAIGKALSGESSLPPAEFDQYFNDIVFPLFTEWKPIKGPGGKETSPLVEGLGGVNPPKMRNRFKADFASKATNAAAHEHLNTLTLTKMDQIATGNFHPVLRANAVMMIAELNDSDPSGPPWKKAVPVLLNYVKSKDMIDAVRVPAWRGLVRQAQSGIDASDRVQVVAAAIQALGQRNNMAGHSQDAQDWICRRAIDVLTALNDPAAAAAILETVNDASTSLTIRAAAAEALSKIKFSPPANFNVTALAKTLGKLAVEDFKFELQQGAKHNPIVADRLKQQLMQIRLGLLGADGNGGVHAMTTAADAQQYINSLRGPIDNLITACNTPLLDPPVPTAAYGGGSVVVPIDRQKNLADAIAAAGSTLEAAVIGGEAGVPSSVPGASPEKNPPTNNPLGLGSKMPFSHQTALSC